MHVTLINQQEDNFVLACSALKRSYRNTLLLNDNDDDDDAMAIVMLIPSKEVLQRLEIRNDHEFMPMSLLDSQLETLDISRASEGGRGENDDDDDDAVWCIEVSESDGPQHVVDSIHRLLFDVK